MFPGVDTMACAASDNPVSASIAAVREQGGPMGAILDHACSLTGSEGEAIQLAIDHYAAAYNPIFAQMLEAMQDDDVRNEVSKRLVARHRTVASIKRGRKDEDK